MLLILKNAAQHSLIYFKFSLPFKATLLHKSELLERRERVSVVCCDHSL